MGNLINIGASLRSRAARGIKLGDVDGDGDLHALVGDDDGLVLWLYDGTGTFSNSGSGLGDPKCKTVAVGDVDGDGDLDAFIAIYEQPDKVWLNVRPFKVYMPLVLRS